MERIVKRFIKYVKIDTESDETSKTCPSTDKQFDLAHILVEEMKQMGLANVSLDDNGYIMATLPSNTDKKVDAIGLIAHMDTAPAFSGKDVKPRIISNYDGSEIVLNEDKKIIMTPSMFPSLEQYIDDDLIVTDGTTLLGADNKAGITEILEAVQYFIDNPEIEHGDIQIGFTPDEEIGRGANLFDVEKFGADYAYTVDGGEIGELEYENFNAASAKIIINGTNIHPGSAKMKMKNSMLIAMELNSMLPSFEIPAYTEKYEGFFHLYNIEGNVEQTKITYIIRDHDKKKFTDKKELIESIVKFLNKKYGSATVELELEDSYYNMKEKIEPVMHIVNQAVIAMEEANVKPLIKPIRGGTDGARLSYMGLPTPNIFTGGHNFHGKYEYISIQSMKKAVEVVVNIIKNAAK